MKTKNIVAFDFDGTLTTKDTFLEFIIFTCGVKSFYLGILLYSPLLVLMTLHLYPNGKAKEKVFSYFFKGWDYSKFDDCGKRFAVIVNQFQRKEVVSKLQKHIIQDDTVYVITASIEEWVRPWCEQYGVKAVLGTKIEVVDGTITGRFMTKNCFGVEKVKRLLEVEPDRGAYVLYAYGDSRGDNELISFADKGEKIF